MRRITDTIPEACAEIIRPGGPVIRRTELTVEREQFSIEVIGEIPAEWANRCPFCGTDLAGKAGVSHTHATSEITSHQDSVVARDSRSTNPESGEAK